MFCSLLNTYVNLDTFKTLKLITFGTSFKGDIMLLRHKQSARIASLIHDFLTFFVWINDIQLLQVYYLQQSAGR